MSSRPTSLRIASDPAMADLVASGKLRPSIGIEAAAAAMGVDESWVRKLLLQPDGLEGYKPGKRAIRVYVDSIAAYQKRHPVGGNPQEKPAPRRKSETRPAQHAAHREAMAALLAAGVLQQDGGRRARRGRG